MIYVFIGLFTFLFNVAFIYIHIKDSFILYYAFKKLVIINDY